MGFEFRRFKPLTSEEFHHNFTEYQKMEEKNDVYLIVVDKEGNSVIPETIGIKLAYMSQFEIKIRKKRKKSGIEKWKKIHCFSEKVDLSDQDNLLKSIENQLKMNQVSDLALSSNHHRVVSAKTCKIRRNYRNYEIAFFSLKFEDVNETLYFKSVNIEGEKKFKKIDKQLVEKDLPLSSQDAQVLTCGYPELLLRKYLSVKSNIQN
ncbi:predicted protein [Naegleria gruberi]|uniref:Predicted protein n=1 Tax=Naegleria gruberi TaxID=5762 RepID=D2W5X8_NAEGR|nr:uncharacterized protein NAEGRDRAFT_76822 [Naegleria gruberi]EFC35524.1 predicted protein [Naegleria gruberi]|eukprot:XP_002668268.1 predicted protein [Naegleria gruberi strain NEG-M]